MIDPQIIADDLYGAAPLRQVIGSPIQCSTFAAAGLSAKNNRDGSRHRLKARKKPRLYAGVENSLIFGIAEAVSRQIESHLFGREHVLAGIPGANKSAVFFADARDFAMVFQAQGGSFPVQTGEAGLKAGNDSSIRRGLTFLIGDFARAYRHDVVDCFSRHLEGNGFVLGPERLLIGGGLFGGLIHDPVIARQSGKTMENRP
jgi:hypothetical protein